MYVSNIKQLTSFQNCFGFLRERVKWLFLISNVSAWNITLCSWQHVARELRVDPACLLLLPSRHAWMSVQVPPKERSRAFEDSSSVITRFNPWTDHHCRVPSTPVSCSGSTSFESWPGSPLQWPRNFVVSFDRHNFRLILGENVKICHDCTNIPSFQSQSYSHSMLYDYAGETVR